MRLSHIALPLVLALAIGAPAVSLLADQRPSEPRTRTLLAVFAHPDDETVVGPLLAHYAAQAGTKVHLVLATSGDQGVTPFAKIPAGDALAAARVREAHCAASALGIEPPILLGLPDGGLADTALLAKLAARLTAILGELKPDAIVTWGPEGGYGHPDHRLVGAVVTQIVQQGDTAARLYFSAYPRSAMRPELLATLKFPAPFTPVADEHLDVRVPYSADAATRAARALQCHASQFTPEVMAQLSALSEQLLKGTAWLRSWRGGVMRTSLFD